MTGSTPASIQRAIATAFASPSGRPALLYDMLTDPFHTSRVFSSSRRLFQAGYLMFYPALALSLTVQQRITPASAARGRRTVERSRLRR